MALIVGLACLLFPSQEGRIDDTQIRRLIEQLGADFLEEREPARKALEQAGKAAEPHLVAALGHADHRVRRACLELLTLLKTPAALKRAADLFSADEDPTVREAAFRLLQALGRDSEDALIDALANPNLEFRRGAIQSLSDMKSQKCVGRIAELCERESDKATKDLGWKLLLSIGKPAETYLLKYLQDQDPEIRKGALLGLRGSQEEATLAAVARQFDQETEEAVLHQATEFLVSTGLRAEPAFLAGLKNARPLTQKNSLQGLKSIKSEKALEPVAALFLADGPVDVRETAAECLKAMGLRAEEPLIRGLENKEAAVQLASIRALGEMGSEKAIPAVGRLFREKKDKEFHKKCFEFLARLGIKAEEDLLVALGDGEKEIRQGAVVALGDAQSERAIPFLIDIMTGLDSAMKEAAEIALASIGTKAVEAISAAVAAGRLRKPVAEAIEMHYTRGEVERILEKQLSKDLSTGFYEGQFDELASFGRGKAMPVLFQILNEKSYVLSRAHRYDREVFRERMKELSVMAAGELGGEGALEAVRLFSKDEIQGRSRRVQEETLVALHRLGDPAPLEEHLRDVRRQTDSQLAAGTVDQKVEGCSQLFSLGLLLTRLKKYEDAIGVYQERLRVIDLAKLDQSKDEYADTTLYNLACLHSLLGRKEKAIEWLQKAVRAGYQDREWMKKDKDLDAIRGEEAYKKLVADDSLFDKKADGAPPADR